MTFLMAMVKKGYKYNYRVPALRCPLYNNQNMFEDNTRLQF